MNSQIPAHIQSVLEKIYSQTKPISIFLYGSMSRGDSSPESDYEIGVIYHQKNKISRTALLTYHSFSNLKIYSFTIEDLQNHHLDTPFPKSFYLLQLIDNADILFGENVFLKITKPVISSVDLVEMVAFSLGRAYAAVVSSRQNDTVAVIDHLTKSFFYGLQALAFINTKKIIYSYHDLRNIDLPLEYLPLSDHVFSVRSGEVLPDNNFLYKNISFLNLFVMPLAKVYQ